MLPDETQVRLADLALTEAGRQAAELAEAVADEIAETDLAERSGSETLRRLASGLRAMAGREFPNGDPRSEASTTLSRSKLH